MKHKAEQLDHSYKYDGERMQAAAMIGESGKVMMKVIEKERSTRIFQKAP